MTRREPRLSNPRIEKHCVGLELPRKDFIEYVVHFFNEQANY